MDLKGRRKGCRKFLCGNLPVSMPEVGPHGRSEFFLELRLLRASRACEI